MKKIEVGLFGSSGRMGREIQSLIKDRPDFRLSSVGSRDKDSLFKSGSSQKLDLWIDFSSDLGFQKILDHCVREELPLLSGTTGLSQKSKKSLDLAAKKIPIFWSSNMSLGVFVLRSMIPNLESVRLWDFEILEIHHKEKKDKPSGTAINLWEDLKELTQEELDPPISVRRGFIFGEHQIRAFGPHEEIEITHRAYSRRPFAEGALDFSRLLLGRPPGLYGVSSFLNKPKRSL